MNINNDVFFDDKGLPNTQIIPSEAVKMRQASLPPLQKPKQKRSVFLSLFLCSFTANITQHKISNAVLQRKL